MKRTVVMEIEMPDADAYADAIEELMGLKAATIKSIKWTRGEEIKAILEARGSRVVWSHGAVGKDIRRGR